MRGRSSVTGELMYRLRGEFVHPAESDLAKPRVLELSSTSVQSMTTMSQEHFFDDQSISIPETRPNLKFITSCSAFPDWGRPSGFSSYFTSDPASRESEGARPGYGSYDSGHGSGSPTGGYEDPAPARGSGVREGKEDKGGYGGYGAAVQSAETSKGE